MQTTKRSPANNSLLLPETYGSHKKFRVLDFGYFSIKLELIFAFITAGSVSLGV